MIASFSVVPMGVGEELKEYVAQLVPIIEASGIDYAMGAMQTTLEGDADAVMAVIMKCHQHMKSVAPRVLTHITIDDREGATGRIKGKVADVEDVLGRSVSRD